jgi:MFS family permease
MGLKMTNARLGPVLLTPGVKAHHALTFLYCAFMGITLNTFINFIQPYVLNEQLRIPESAQGALTGNIVFLSELMLLFACGVMGLLADRIGRRAVFAFGFLILAAGFACYGYVRNEEQLLLLRLGMAWGVAAINVMVTTLQADYPQEESRGKLVGFTGFSIGLGALFLVFVLARLPEWYAAGTDAQLAGRYTLLTVGFIALASAALSAVGLRPGHVGGGEQRLKWWPQLLSALRCSSANPRVGLAYACAFVARGDLIVIGVFFSLWLTQTAVAAGMDTAEALALAGMYFGIVQAVALVSAPLIGALIDRLDRVTATVAALLLAALGYGGLGFVNDPLGPLMIPAAVMLGLGQMAVMLASQTLIAQEAPASQRGAVMGMFSVCGALGIMFITKVGGQVFDTWKPGPFVIVALANLLLSMFALALRLREKRGLSLA